MTRVPTKLSRPRRPKVLATVYAVRTADGSWVRRHGLKVRRVVVAHSKAGATARAGIWGGEVVTLHIIEAPAPRRRKRP